MLGWGAHSRAAVALFAWCCAVAHTACVIRPVRLRTNSLQNPLGIQTEIPTFSWALEALTTPPSRGQVQSGYRLLLSTSPGGPADVWDSGWVASDESLHIPFGGSPLAASQRVFWAVRVWDGSGAACPQSDEAWFETALFSDADWRGARWLARYRPRARTADCEMYERSERNRAPRFRTEFEMPPSVIAVLAYVSGLGYYQLYIDGVRVGTSRLDPGWTTYDQRVLYSTYDVTEMLVGRGNVKDGGGGEGTRHAIGVELGNGWWNPLPLKFWGHLDIREALVSRQGEASPEPMFKLCLLARMSDGSRRVLASSALGAEDGRTTGWQAGGSPTTFNSAASAGGK